QRAMRVHGVDEDLEALVAARVAAEIHRQAGETRGLALQRLVDVEHHADQRQARGIALELDLLQQRAERVALVLDRVEQGVLGVAEQLLERLRRVQVEAQRQ